MAIKRTQKHTAWMLRLEAIKLEIEAFKDGRQEKFDEKSEKWQGSDKGNEEGSNLTDLETIINNLEEAHDSMDTLFEEV